MDHTQTQLAKAMAQKAIFTRVIAAHRLKTATEGKENGKSENETEAREGNGKTSISVHFRTRPLNKAEIAKGYFKVLYCSAAGTALYYPAFGILTDNTLDVQEFKFDSNHDEDATNTLIYNADVRPRLQEALANNGLLTVIAYGQTGSGKTFTMSSMATQLVADLPLEDGAETTATVSMIEIQGDGIRDLAPAALVGALPGAGGGGDGADAAPAPRVLLDARGAPVVLGVRAVAARSRADVLRAFARGFDARATRATLKNRQSSRSHFVCTIRIARGGGGGGETLVRIVDLAGSEAGNDKTDHDAAAIKESIAINKSLSAFKECIRKLNAINSAAAGGGGGGAPDAANAHIPFRNSKLTMVLKDALDPNTTRHTHTAVFAVAAPTIADIAHTFNTYRYALALKSLGASSGSVPGEPDAMDVLQHGNLAGVAPLADKQPQQATKENSAAGKPAATTPMAWSRAKLERWIENQFENQVTLPMILGPSGDPGHYGRPQTSFVLPPWKFIYGMSADEWVRNVATNGGYRDEEKVRKVREKYKALFLKERIVADGGVVGNSSGGLGKGTVLMLEVDDKPAEKKKTRAEIAMEKAKAKGAALRTK